MAAASSYRKSGRCSGSASTLRAVLLVAACLGLAAPARAADVAVDLELVLAIDVSQSVDVIEGRMQREGYIRAFSDPRVAQALRNGQYGKIAVTYVEWAGVGWSYTIVPWRVLASAEDARAFAVALDNHPVTRGQGTSISGAITEAAASFVANGAAGARRVIDISGDGPNSSGFNVTVARDDAVAQGITINGVAINDREITNFSLPDLDVYFQDCVVGGPGAFVIAADGFASFAEAILRKLILEIADLHPLGRERFGAPVLERAQVLGRGAGPAPQKYGPRCDIGERMRLQDQQGLPPFVLPLR